MGTKESSYENGRVADDLVVPAHAFYSDGLGSSIFVHPARAPIAEREHCSSAGAIDSPEVMRSEAHCRSASAIVIVDGARHFVCARVSVGPRMHD